MSGVPPVAIAPKEEEEEEEEDRFWQDHELGGKLLEDLRRRPPKLH